MAEQMKPSGIDWIGDIPNEWGITKVRFVTKLRSEQGFYNSDDKYIGLENISSYTGEYISTESEYDAGTYDLYKAGDLLFSKLRPYLAKALIADDCGFCTGELAVIKEYNGDIRYLFYYMLSDGFLKMVDASTYGAKMPRASWDYIKNLQIPVMRKSEQQAIVDFLDKECAQIDSIATDLEKQIALLQQYKKSLITETVTKGLDKSVPMKDSGVEWIGEIPEHWEISRVRHLASLCSGATPSKDVLSYWEGNIPWVSSQEVKSDIIKDTSLHISEEAINSCSTQLMPAGTLVMVVRSGILQHTIPVALLGVPATINQDIKAFQFNHLMLPAYFKYYIQGENDALLSVIIKDKTTVESVDNQLLLSLKIMVPPIEEQKAIVAFLNYKCGYIDKILNDKQEQLNLLMQHKKSLIYEYVTGKKRVKEVQ